MPPYTKNAIVASFIKIVSKKPLDRVTVRDIVDDCSVNRNTFYYYFQDVYAVVEEIFDAQGQRISDALEEDDTLGEVFVSLVAFFEDNLKMIRSIYASSIRENLEGYIYDAARGIVERRVMREICRRNGGREPGTHEREGVEELITFSANAFAGYILIWMRDGMKGDIASKLLTVSRNYENGLKLYFESRLWLD